MRAGQAQVVGAKPVVGHDDVGHLGPGGGVLGQGRQHVGQGHRRGRLVRGGIRVGPFKDQILDVEAGAPDAADGDRIARAGRMGVEECVDGGAAARDAVDGKGLRLKVDHNRVPAREVQRQGDVLGGRDGVAVGAPDHRVPVKVERHLDRLAGLRRVDDKRHPVEFLGDAGAVAQRPGQAVAGPAARALDAEAVRLVKDQRPVQIQRARRVGLDPSVGGDPDRILGAVEVGLVDTARGVRRPAQDMPLFADLQLAVAVARDGDKRLVPQGGARPQVRGGDRIGRGGGRGAQLGQRKADAPVALDRVADGHGKAAGRIGARAKRRVIHLDPDIQPRVRLEVERGARLEEQFLAHDLKQMRVGPGQRQVVGAQAVVHDLDVGDLDRRGCRGVLEKLGHGRRHHQMRRRVDRRAPVRPVKHQIPDGKPPEATDGDGVLRAGLIPGEEQVHVGARPGQAVHRQGHGGEVDGDRVAMPGLEEQRRIDRRRLAAPIGSRGDGIPVQIQENGNRSGGRSGVHDEADGIKMLRHPRLVVQRPGQAVPGPAARRAKRKAPVGGKDKRPVEVERANRLTVLPAMPADAHRILDAVERCRAFHPAAGASGRRQHMPVLVRLEHAVAVPRDGREHPLVQGGRSPDMGRAERVRRRGRVQAGGKLNGGKADAVGHCASWCRGGSTRVVCAAGAGSRDLFGKPARDAAAPACGRTRIGPCRDAPKPRGIGLIVVRSFASPGFFRRRWQGAVFAKDPSPAGRMSSCRLGTVKKSSGVSTIG